MAILVALGCALGAALPARAQLATGPDAKAEVKLPGTWLNTAPPTLAGLRGKAVLLYFFEESCPRCKGQWPTLMQVAARHENDPIAFVAVNSGTAAPVIESYARSVRLDWPILLDLDRSFEQSAGIGEISLSNIVQVCFLTPDGKMKLGQWSDLEGTITRALEGAAWKVDPAEIPDELRPAWRSIEFANYADAATAVNKALGSRKNEIKAAAQKLSQTVEAQAKQDMDAAQAEAEKSKYRAYDRYGTIAEQYAGFAVVSAATTARRELAKDPELRQELVAIKAIEKQRPLLASSRDAVRERATAAIKKIIEANPESEAARLGRELLGE
ncbi:MAG: TlpA family protein disulfide reductase [Pirellulales bacterium]